MIIPSKIPLLINGGDLFPESFFTNANPLNNESLNEIAIAEQMHIDQAMEAGTEAQHLWAQRTPQERAVVLRKAAMLLREKNLDLAKIETLDTGRPIRETSTVDIESAAEILDYSASYIQCAREAHIPVGQHSFAYVKNKPLGLCLGIGAWNYPLQIAAWKSAPALAMGNSMIFKPSELTPTTAFLLGKIYEQAGLPPGVFQVLQGGRSVGQALVEHPAVKKISLTGSVSTGQKIFNSPSPNLKKYSFELGGKSALIIFEDANLDASLQAALLANFYSQGEICSNGTRVFVHERIYKSFREGLLTEMKKIKIGPPLDMHTHMGPLINQAHRNKVQAFVDQAIKEGAKITQTHAHLEGAFFSPTLIENCTDQMSCVTEEIFGPVMCLMSFQGEEEVIERANNTPYGLAAGVFTNELTRAHRVANKLHAGISWINSYNLTPVEIPFGGVKASGLGSENGHEVFQEYTQKQTIYVNASRDFDSFF